MVDLHSHIIYDVDDGANSIQESIAMLKEAEKAGFTDVFLTSHYLENYYEVPTKELQEKKEILEQEMQNQNIHINIYVGREIYITPDISQKILSGEVSTLNNSKYVLVEIPMNNRILYLEHELSNIIENGLVPILAHPERYGVVQRDFNYLTELKNMGVLFQINYGSILGVYGSNAKKVVKKMLKNDMVDFIGTDCHRPNSLYEDVELAIKKISKLIPKNKLYEITEINAKNILNKS